MKGWAVVGREHETGVEVTRTRQWKRLGDAKQARDRLREQQPQVDWDVERVDRRVEYA